MNIVDSLKSADCAICLLPLHEPENGNTAEEGVNGLVLWEGRRAGHSSSSSSGYSRSSSSIAEGSSLSDSDMEEEDTTENRIVVVRDGAAEPRPAEDGESDSGIVVLPCGHLFHYVCFAQLAEYAMTHDKEKCACPVCRAKVSPDDAIPLRWRPRPTHQRSIGVKSCRDEDHTIARRNAVPSTRSHHRKLSGESTEVVAQVETGTGPKTVDLEGGEIVLVKENQVPAAEAYRAFVQRNTAATSERLRSLRSRTQPLSGKHQQMEQEVIHLRCALDAEERRMKALRGSTNTGCDWKELRRLSQELKFSLDTCTAEMAAVMREIAMLDTQAERYTEKIEDLKAKLLETI